MDTPDEFEALARACIATHDEIMKLGSREMKSASRLLLFALGLELLRLEKGSVDDTPESRRDRPGGGL